MKNIIIALIFICTFIIGNSQDKIRIGFNGGMNISKTFGNDFDKDAIIGINGIANFQFEYYFKDNIALKSGLAYDRVSRLFDSRIFTLVPGNNNKKTKFYNDYIGMFVLSKFEFSQKKFFYLEVGTFFDFLLSDVIQGYSGNKTKNDIKEDKRLNTGIMAGFGFQIPITDKHRINIEIVEKLGLVNLVQNPISSSYKKRTTSLGILVGWNMGL